MIPAEVGWAIPIGVFVLAGALLAAKVRARRAAEERLRELGFESCEDEAPRLLELFTRLAGGHLPGQARRFQVGRCFKRPAGTGFVYRFTAADLSVQAPRTDDQAAVAPVSDVYLLDLGARAKAVLRPCSLFLSNLGGGLFHGMLAKLVATQPLGQRLELPSERAASFLAAFGAARGKLEEHLGAPLVELAERASATGFFAAHFGNGQAALLAPQGMRDVDAQWNTLADWVSA